MDVFQFELQYKKIKNKLDRHVRPDLFWCSSRCGVCDGPCSLFPGPELCFLQNFDEDWEDVGINYRLRSKKRQKK